MSQHPCAARVALTEACAVFIESRLDGQPLEVIRQVGPTLADSYYNGTIEAATRVINIATETAHGPCRECPTLRGIVAEAAALVAESHGATADGRRKS